MVAKLYAERGYLAARVETALHATREPTAKVLVIAIREGAPTRIRSIGFEGEAPVDPAAVRSSVDLGAGDVLDRRKLLDSIAKADAFLRERGYLEAELDAPRTRFDGDLVDVIIPAHVGPRYELSIRGYEGHSRSRRSSPRSRSHTSA